MPEDTPLLNTLAVMTAASVDACDLDERELMLARIAALVAVGAPAASYLLNVGTAVDLGITLEDVEGVLIAVAPIVGTVRTISAASAGKTSAAPMPSSTDHPSASTATLWDAAVRAEPHA